MAKTTKKTASEKLISFIIDVTGAEQDLRQWQSSQVSKKRFIFLLRDDERKKMYRVHGVRKFASIQNPKILISRSAECKMHPSGEVGRFQMENLSSPPRDWCRYGRKMMELNETICLS